MPLLSREPSALFQSVWEHAADAMVLSDPDSIVLMANPAYYQLYGYPPDQIIGHTFAVIFPPEQHEWAIKQYRLVFSAAQAPPAYESVIRRADGTYGVVESRIQFIAEGDQRRAMLSIIRDITERKRAEAERLRRTAQFRGLADAALAINTSLSFDAVLQTITEQARVIIDAHLAVASVTVDQQSAQTIDAGSLSDGYAAWRDYRAPAEGLGMYTLVCQTNQSVRMTQAELEAHPAWRGIGKSAGQHLPMRGWLAAPLIGRNGQNIGLIQMSDKVQGEFSEEDEAMLVQLAQMASVALENARLYQQAQDAIHLRDTFLSIAAHELKTPLTSMLGNVQLLERRTQRDGTLPERDERALHVVSEQGRRLNKMISTLLNISRIDLGQLSIEHQPVDLDGLIRRLIEEIVPALDRHTIVYERPSESLIVVGDDLRLEQVLHNLIGNAVKYSPAGGPIAVAISRRGNMACISVTDQGMGVPAREVLQLFQRFYRAANAEAQYISGMGIGLYMVKEIVTLHGGTVHVESVEGQGSCFTVCLPLIG